jgi:hypothetical protein
MSRNFDPAVLLAVLVTTGLAVMFWRQLLVLLGVILAMLFAVGTYEAVLLFHRW